MDLIPEEQREQLFLQRERELQANRARASCVLATPSSTLRLAANVAQSAACLIGALASTYFSLFLAAALRALARISPLRALALQCAVGA